MKLERRVKRNSVKTRYISIESPPFRCNPEKKSKEKNKTNKFIKEEKEKKNPTTRSDRPADVEERKWTRFFFVFTYLLATFSFPLGVVTSPFLFCCHGKRNPIMKIRAGEDGVFFFSLKRNASAVPFRERDLLSLSRISRNDRFVKLVINRFF